MDAIPTMDTILNHLNDSKKSLRSLKRLFGFFSPRGRESAEQSSRREELQAALARECARMNWLHSDLTQGNNLRNVNEGEMNVLKATRYLVFITIAQRPPDQLQLAIQGLEEAGQYIYSNVLSRLRRLQKSAPKPEPELDLAQDYHEINRNLHSAMAQAGRAVEFFRQTPLCTWSRHQCYVPDPQDQPTQLRFVPAIAHAHAACEVGICCACAAKHMPPPAE
ncbi:hypothetical protein EDB81DRAFT_948124 [Dactylonectria macrodidyma]|uniref:Uncharacterized protein n=1 Tax=Dactylonectria macrodidyma TaxID=307937 RepID=A0A9P9ELG0_9HYPO|nr:hypothetical protein EDB81DRAFT_948124 [Dactylonectria macrodidyma]